MINDFSELILTAELRVAAAPFVIYTQVLMGKFWGWGVFSLLADVLYETASWQACCELLY
jgi:hypothetical protein